MWQGGDPLPPEERQAAVAPNGCHQHHTGWRGQQTIAINELLCRANSPRSVGVLQFALLPVDRTIQSATTLIAESL